MNLAAIQAFSARAAAVSLAPAIVLIAGTEYPATVPEPRVLGNLIDGGEEIAAATLSARILLTDLATAPAVNQPLQWKRPAEATWRTTTWLIDEIRRSPIDAEWLITCSPKN